MTSSEPHTLIHVRNLQTNLPLSIDAWGRPSSSQPVLISLSVSLRQPFTSSSSTDTVASSTIHYGLLSKAVLGFCETFTEKVQSKRSSEGGRGETLSNFALDLALHLYGPQGVLNGGVAEFLKLGVFLPKASLLGNGVGLTTTLWASEEDVFRFVEKKSALELKELKIPCIIGVNTHEREAKQLVVATVSLENWDLEEEGQFGDSFNVLERVIVDAISPSSFQTLEAMTTHITTAIISRFLLSMLGPLRDHHSTFVKYPRIRILLEKPTAVTFADAPGVEVLVESDPKLNETARAAWEAV